MHNLEEKIRGKQSLGLSMFMEGLFFWDRNEEYSYNLHFWKTLLTVKTAQTGFIVLRKVQEPSQSFCFPSFDFTYSFASP